MDLGIAGRVALVGGATQGIGRAIAAALIAEGAQVVISARDAERTRRVADELGAVAGYAWDSADLDGAASLVAGVGESVGPVEILVVNTGGPPASADPLALSREQWEQAHRTLVQSPLALITAALPGMRERGFGRIVNVASTSVREPIPGLMLSNAERSAALAALATVACEVAADGVTVNTLLTGMIATERLAELSGSIDAAEAVARRDVPAARLGRPEEIAAAAAFLCSVPAAYVTGVALAVDGGRLRGV